MAASQPALMPYGKAAIAAAADCILSGGIVAIPTETVYGLAADAGDARAVARIYAAKGRPSFNPLIVHVADLAAAAALGEFDAQAEALARRHWPGPLTLVVPRRAGAPVAALATAGLDTIAIRVPRHRAIRALIAATGRPLAAPSANRSNALSPTRAAHVAASLGAAVPLIVDDGASEAGVESTIVMAGRVLRPGPIVLDLPPAAEGGGGPVVAPGQIATHYAPRTPLRLDAVAARPGEYHLGFGAVAGDETLSARGDTVEAAAALFDALHRADTRGAAAIAVAPIPDRGLGVAINDRLRRAATR